MYVHVPIYDFFSGMETCFFLPFFQLKKLGVFCWEDLQHVEGAKRKNSVRIGQDKRFVFLSRVLLALVVRKYGTRFSFCRT